MEFGQLMINLLVYVSCKFDLYILKIAKVIGENVRIAFLYVLSIHVVYKSNSSLKLLFNISIFIDGYIFFLRCA